MTISPIQVYFALQADDIKTGLAVGLYIAAAARLALSVIPRCGWAGAFTEDDEKKWKDIIKNSPGLTSPILLSMAASIVIAFAPSTKTVAASVIAPAIVNSQAVKKDIPELYQLGIEAIKSAIGPKP